MGRMDLRSMLEILTESILPPGPVLPAFMATGEGSSCRMTQEKPGGRYSTVTATSMTSPLIQRIPTFYTPQDSSHAPGVQPIVVSIGPGSQDSTSNGGIA